MSETVSYEKRNDALAMLRSVGSTIDDLYAENRCFLAQKKGYEQALKEYQQVAESERERRIKAMDDLGVAIMFMQIMSGFVMISAGFAVYSWW